MYIQLIITGVLLIALALVHLIFPSYFNWKKELPLLSLVNRQLMTVHGDMRAHASSQVGDEVGHELDRGR